MRRLLLLALPALLAACSVDRTGLGGGGGGDLGTDAPMSDGGTDLGTDIPDLGPDMPDMPDLGPCGPGCVAPMTCCGSTCVDPTSDPLHCGGCTACPTAAHATPTCATSTCGVACDPGFGDCDATVAGCESDLTALATCGSCTTDCRAAAHETAMCTPGGCATMCDVGFADCDAAARGCETDTTSSAANCGRCGNACGFGRACATSACSPGWLATTTTGAPSARQDHTAVWTGTRMIVWGGVDGGGELNTGGVYDPITDTWTATTTTGAPSARRGHVAVWTGTEMIVWGGFGGGAFLATGGAYDPATNTWRPLATTTLEGRSRLPSLWTGTQLLIWGGWNGGGSEVSGDGALYAPDAWTGITMTTAPSARRWQAAAWAGTQMVVFSGENATGTTASDGGRYDPVMDRWGPTSTTTAPSGRARAVSVWTGSRFVVWGGDAGDSGGVFSNTLRSSGGVYDPIGDTWTATAASPLGGRSRAVAVWTGSQMLVWGGRDADTPFISANFFGDGAGYDPTGDAWTAMSGTGAPSARWAHTAVWTGTEMIVWGGSNGVVMNTGGRFAP